MLCAGTRRWRASPRNGAWSTHAHTETVTDSCGRRPAAGCEPVRRRYRRERAAVRLRQAHTGAEEPLVRPAVPGTWRHGPADRDTRAKLPHHGYAARL